MCAMQNGKREERQPTAQDFRTSDFGLTVTLGIFFFIIILAMVLS